jgi:hypothetical protein
MLNILQSLLAFAATMLVLATLVTLIIEIVARIFRRRYRIFTHLLRQLFKNELQPIIESRIKTRLGEDPDKVAIELEAQLGVFLDEIRNSPLETVPGYVSALKAEGIPIGLDYFPFCRYRKAIKKDGEDAYPCKDPESRYRIVVAKDSDKGLWPDYLLWIIKVIITGVLIGLGGPFWYDAVRGLARATQILRGRAEPQNIPAGSLPGDKMPANPTEIFDRHVEKDDNLPGRG